MTKIKHKSQFKVDVNALVDEGEGVISFPNGLVITDTTEQRNGTVYDIESLDITEFNGTVTIDHDDSVEKVVAKVEGTRKVNDSVIIDRIVYAVKESPLARLVYNLTKSGFVTDFSTETYGPPATNGFYYNSALVGLSEVVTGNNKSARIVANSLEESINDGFSKEEVEEEFKQALGEEEVEVDETAEIKSTETDEITNPTKDEEIKTNKKEETNEMKFVTIKNSRSFAVKVAYNNAAGDAVETTVAPDATIDVAEDQKAAVEEQIAKAEDPTVAEEAAKVQENKVAEMIKNALGAKDQEIADLKAAFNKLAEAPAFKKAGEAAENKFGEMGWKERYQKQVNAAWDYLKGGNIEAGRILNDINAVNLEALKAAEKVENTMTIADFSNFVIAPEMLTQIVGQRNDYTAIINATEWQETNSLEFAWIKRVGDIDMKNVAFCDDGADGNLKPISEYETEDKVSKLEELAAVTPVCTAATRFLAVDLLGDVARGYRNDYDRKRAQLVIARLEQAVEETGASRAYNTSATGTGKVEVWLDAMTDLSDSTVNGTFIFNSRTYSELRKAALAAGPNGPLADILLSGEVRTVWGQPYVVVPNDLLPTLGAGDTRTFQVEGANVVINHAVFYADLGEFTGRTSGGLQYDLSTDASYEVNGVVRSAYQRNEMVLRGSFFRGGAVKDASKVAGVLSGAAS